jgi:hyperosmotically inducible periplasmic protein
MKSLRTSLSLIALLGLGGGLATFPTGCASTPTRESTGEFVDDVTITAKVKAAFIRDRTVKAFDVSVDTFKGVVQLSGFVDTAEQKDRAGEIARGIHGVREVKNRLTVK